MKLFLKKDSDGNITIQIQKGTVFIEYDYVEMLKQLIETNKIECEWENIEDFEQEKFIELLDRIKEAVDEGLNRPLE